MKFLKKYILIITLNGVSLFLNAQKIDTTKTRDSNLNGNKNCSINLQNVQVSDTTGVAVKICSWLQNKRKQIKNRKPETVNCPYLCAVNIFLKQHEPTFNVTKD